MLASAVPQTAMHIRKEGLFLLPGRRFGLPSGLLLLLAFGR
ncbi:hypothetical protein SAMN05216525_109138 [Bradyrhizobium sp. Gha]|nr:hypothetical protein SAMN05216525_109138 [Bradyrhizobium sp. Gha]